MCYTSRMIKQLLLIAALVPTASAAHDFDQDKWLQQWLGNRIDIGKCLKLTETDIPAFHSTCDLDAMVTIENKKNARYRAEKLVHPLDDDLTFITEHFAHKNDMWIWGVYKNIEQTPAFKSALINMYIVKGLTKESAAVHAPKGSTSTVDKRPGNNQVHDK